MILNHTPLYQTVYVLIRTLILILISDIMVEMISFYKSINKIYVQYGTRMKSY